MADDDGRPVTLQDVATAAGVSLATASRAINGSTRRVRADLHAKVLEAAERLEYRANPQAQAMARGRASVIGLLVHDIADPYFSAIASGVIAEAERHGLLVTLASTERSAERELAHLAALRAQRPRGVIVAGSRQADPAALARFGAELDAFIRSGGRVALVSQDVLDVPTVALENRAGGHDLAVRLVELGYRRFAVLATEPWLVTSNERAEGFTEGLATAGDGEVAANAVGEFTRDGGYAAMSALLGRLDEFDCVVAVNDVMAVGAMAALREHGLRLPDDVAVAGFDDITTLRDVTPTLTTVRFPLVEVGAAAMAMVLGAEEEPRVRHVPGEVVVRESTPPVA